jgi:hypothetical protein
MKKANKILLILAIIMTANCYAQIDIVKRKVTLDSINGRIANIHMNDSVIFHAGTNIEGGYSRDSVYQYLQDSSISDSHITDSTIEITTTGGIGDNNFWIRIGHYIAPRMMFAWSNANDTKEVYQLLDTNNFYTYISNDAGSGLLNGVKLKQASTEDYFGVNLRKDYIYGAGVSDFFVDTNGVEILNDLTVNGNISADNYEKHVTKFDWDYTDGIYFQNNKLNGKYIIVTSVILREITQLSSTSGTTTVTLIDEGSSGVVWASIIADGIGALELTNETIQVYPVYVNDNGIVENFTFVGSVDDLTGGSLSVYIEYIEFDL